MLAKLLSMIAVALLWAGGALAQQTSTPASPDADASGPKAGAPSKTQSGNAHTKRDKAMMSTDKAGKPPGDEAASQPTAKKPAKKGAQAGPAASQ